MKRYAPDQLYCNNCNKLFARLELPTGEIVVAPNLVFMPDGVILCQPCHEQRRNWTRAQIAPFVSKRVLEELT